MDVSRQPLLTAASLADQPDFRIGNVEIYPSLRIVSAGEHREKVEPRVMQVLIALAHANNEVLTREALFERCWGGVYVGDDSLNRAIAGVRRIATTLGAGSFEIETITRTGYRLISEDGPQLLGEHDNDPDEPVSTVTDHRLSRRWLMAGGLAAVAGTAFLLRRGQTFAPDPAQKLIDDSQIVMRIGSTAAIERGIELLRQAVAKSPDNATAWGLLALALARLDEHSLNRASIDFEEVDAAARQALQRDPDNADAQAALAISIPYYGDWLAAERRFDAILAQHPGHVVAQDSRLFLLGSVGRMKESSDERQKLSGLAPYDASLLFKEVYTLWFAGRIAEADRTALRGLEMWPRHAGIWFARLWVLAGTGRLDRALAHVADESNRPPLPPPMINTITLALEAAQSKQPKALSEATKQLMSGVSRNVAAVINAMMLLNLMGAIDQAFELADAYYLERGPIIAAVQWRPGQPAVPDQRRRKTNMLFVPSATAMQADSRFMPLMKEIGLVSYWDKRGIGPDFLEKRWL